MSQSPPPGAVPPGSPPPGAPAAGGPPDGHAPGWGPAPGPGWGTPALKPGVVALRPLRLSDLFDGAFSTIRRNPTAMVGLAALVNLAFLAIPVLLTLVLAATGSLSGTGRDSLTDGTGGFGAGASTLLGYLGAVFGWLATVVLNGLVVHVVAEAVLGRRTGVADAWRATRGRLPRLVGLLLLSILLAVVLVGVPVAVGVLLGLQVGLGTGIAVGLVLTLLGVVALLWVQVRLLLLASPALVLERLGVVASLRRAHTLSRGQFWRLFGTWLLTALVSAVVGQVIAIPLGIVSVLATLQLSGTVGALVTDFASYVSQLLVGALTTPFTSGVAALQYVDQRIRKEGLDVQLIAAAQQPTTR
jgi:hypothetical protein